MNKKILFQGRVITVVKQKCRLPNNSNMELEIVEHRGAVLIVPFLAKDKIVFIKQFRPVINSYIYELPAGTLEPGESPLACAKREAKEEIGYQAAKFIRVGHIYPVPGYSTEKIHIFKAEGLSVPKVLPARDKDEIIYPAVFTRKQIKDFFDNGKIVDAKTICALSICGLI